MDALVAMVVVAGVFGVLLVLCGVAIGSLLQSATKNL